MFIHNFKRYLLLFHFGQVLLHLFKRIGMENLVLVSAEFLKMKKPYLPLNEFQLGRLPNFSGNQKAPLLNKTDLEYIQKYFPTFNKSNSKKHYEVDDPVIEQHKINVRSRLRFVWNF